MWDLPGPGLELVSPALAGGFLTTAPPGKSLLQIFGSRLRKFLSIPNFIIIFYHKWVFNFSHGFSEAFEITLRIFSFRLQQTD